MEASVWFDSGCTGPRARWTEEGYIEVEGEGVVKKDLPEGVFQWKDLILEKSARYDLPPNFVAGIMGLESGGDPNAGSPAGALGLMQVTLRTGRGLSKNPDLTPEELFDPDLNVELGCRYLAQLWDLYGGNPIKVPFGYNAGSARCGAGIHRGTYGSGETCEPNRWGLVADCWGKDPITVDYATIVFRYANAALDQGFPSDARSLTSSLSSARAASWAKKFGWVIVGAAGAGLLAFGVKAAMDRKLPWPLVLLALPGIPPL